MNAAKKRRFECQVQVTIHEAGEPRPADASLKGQPAFWPTPGKNVFILNNPVSVEAPTVDAALTILEDAFGLDLAHDIVSTWQVRPPILGRASDPSRVRGIETVDDGSGRVGQTLLVPVEPPGPDRLIFTEPFELHPGGLLNVEVVVGYEFLGSTEWAFADAAAWQVETITVVKAGTPVDVPQLPILATTTKAGDLVGIGAGDGTLRFAPGDTVRLVVRNISDKPRRFRAELFGTIVRS